MTPIPAPKVPKKLPIILSPEEVVRFLDSAAIKKNRAILNHLLRRRLPECLDSLRTRLLRAYEDSHTWLGHLETRCTI
jgi:site-specific recombinase XerD